ncbi:hypothetical protein RQP46_002920 [Phenoliferia psychrophenolica]
MLKAPSLPLWDMSPSFPPDIYNDLLAAALVCSRWRDPAQRALFDSVFLDRSRILRDQKFLTSPARPRFRTRSLKVKGCATSRWLDVARATRGLEDLTIRESIVLRWDCLCDASFAGVKHLTLLRPEDFKDAAGLNPSLTMRLETLALWLYEGQAFPPASPAFIAALFAASSASLQTLHLKIFDRKPESSIIPTLHLVAVNLRTLILESTHDVLEGHLDLLSTCTSLEHLELRWDDYDESDSRNNGQPTSLRHALAILDALPSTPTLRHLSLGFDEPLDLVPISLLLMHPTLKFLTHINLPRMAVRDGKDVSLERRRELVDAVVQALLLMKEICERRGMSCTGAGKYCMWESEA